LPAALVSQCLRKTYVISKSLLVIDLVRGFFVRFYANGVRGNIWEFACDLFWNIFI
jgi:hypothetical protein